MDYACFDEQAIIAMPTVGVVMLNTIARAPWVSLDATHMLIISVAVTGVANVRCGHRCGQCPLRSPNSAERLIGPVADAGVGAPLGVGVQGSPEKLSNGWGLNERASACAAALHNQRGCVLF